MSGAIDPRRASLLGMLNDEQLLEQARALEGATSDEQRRVRAWLLDELGERWPATQGPMDRWSSSTSGLSYVDALEKALRDAGALK